MASRFVPRLVIIYWALIRRFLNPCKRKRPLYPKRILIAHHLLLGDTLMLTPLIAKLSQKFPDAEIIMTVPKAFASLYSSRPFNLQIWPFDPSDLQALKFMLKQSNFDLAIVPGDNRFSWLAAALGSKWIVAHAGDNPNYKNWPVDELQLYPSSPHTWGDMVALLIDGTSPKNFSVDQWKAPTFKAFDLPNMPYVVLHVGASTSLKLWEPYKWQLLASHLTKQELTVVWSGNAKEQKIVEAIDPDNQYKSFAGALDLAQLWHLLANASLLICPDTGIAHLGRIVGVPTITLFGPGSVEICGKGKFWDDSPYQTVSVIDFPCRNQDILFRRKISWVKRCGRSQSECSQPACMKSISVDDVIAKINQLNIHQPDQRHRYS